MLKLLSKIINIWNSYGTYGFIRLIKNLILSKLLCPKARILRQPFYIRNEGTLDMGKGFSSNPGLIIDIYGHDSTLKIGKDVIANYNLHIGVCNKVTIGDNVLIASNVFISDHNHGKYTGSDQSSPLLIPNERPLEVSSVSIGNNCWIGEHVSILPGVTIGDGVIIGAGAVVNSSLPDNVIAVGVPARVIKKFNFDRDEWEYVRK